VDHWERPDDQAERDLLPFEDERFFDDGYWRYWVGSGQKLPGNLRLYEEVAYIDSDTVDGDVRWQVSVTRSGWALAGRHGRLQPVGWGQRRLPGLRVPASE
jgi:hypothetical protein